MPTIEFVGQSSQDPDNTAANTSRLLNLYREAINGRSQWVLKSVLGMEAFTQIDGVFLRAMKEVRGVLYIVLGGGLYKVTESGTQTYLAAIADSERTTIDSNNGKVTIAADGRYYVWDGTELAEVTAASLSDLTDANNTYGYASDADISDVVFIGQRSVIIFADRRVQWSDVTEPKKLDALNFATTESRDDNNLRGVVIGGVLWIMKERSIERWSQTPTGLAAIANYTIDRGLKAFGLMVRVPQGVFFVGSDNRAYIGSGQGLGAPISNRAVETSITSQTPTDCFYYADEGHEFYVIRFSDRPAWCFDLATGEWHERSETADYGPWTAVQCSEAFGDFFVGTETGGIHKLARCNEDVNEALHRRAVSRSLRMDGNRFVVRSLEFLGRVGRSELGREEFKVLDVGNGLVLSPGDASALVVSENDQEARPAVMALRVSKDYGQTWGAPKMRTMGDQGEYDTRMIFRGLGQTRSFTIDVTITDPSELTLDGSATVELA